MFFPTWLSTVVDPASNQTILSLISDRNYKCQINNWAQLINAIKHFLIHISSIITVFQHVIFMDHCLWGLGYVGKTSRQLKQYFSEHKNSLRRKDMNYPVALCFNKFNRNGDSGSVELKR